MKFIHLSDLHLGKRVNEYSMLEDQEYILKKIINIVDAEKPDGVIIAGDVYDKSVPAAEAVQLFDNFLVQLAKRKLEVFVISGNHDSPERIAFGSRIMDASGIHMSPVYNGKIVPFSMQDEYGTVDVYMLPFIKPAHVRRFCDDEITIYTDAINSDLRKSRLVALIMWTLMFLIPLIMSHLDIFTHRKTAAQNIFVIVERRSSILFRRPMTKSPLQSSNSWKKETCHIKRLILFRFTILSN